MMILPTRFSFANSGSRRQVLGHMRLRSAVGGERLDTRNPTSKLMLTVLAGVAT
jgi:hypothetical protein